MKTAEEDLSLLISITEDIAEIKDTENLLFTVFQKLHTHYGIKIGGGALFDKTRENLGIILIKIEENKRINESMVWLQTVSVNSAPFGIAVSDSGVTRVDAVDFYTVKPKDQNQPSLKEILGKMNIKSLPLIPIKIGGDLIGFLIITLENTHLSDKADYYVNRTSRNQKVK